MTAQAIPYRGRSREATDERSNVRGPRVLPLVFFVVAVVAVFFSMIFLRISLDETAFELENLQDGIAVEQSTQLDLRYDLARLRDPLRIATEAKRIGLVYPDERVAIVVDLGGADTQVLQPEVPVRALDSDRP
jgi:cell division protein FtsL